MTLTGKIHGRTIELDQPLDWPEGTLVEVMLKRLDKLEKLNLAIGGWKEDSLRDETLAAVDHERHAMLMREE
jgi:hypothetical protein